MHEDLDSFIALRRLDIFQILNLHIMIVFRILDFLVV